MSLDYLTSHIPILVCRVTVGDDFFSSDPEVLVTSLFPKLSLMRKTLATTKSFVLSDKAHTLEEYFHVMKSVGLNDIDEKDCMSNSHFIHSDTHHAR